MTLCMRISQFARRGILVLLALMILLVPLLFSPNLQAWRGVKPIVFEMMALALLGLALVQAGAPRGGRRMLEFLRSGPNLPVILFVLYGAVSWYRSSLPAFSGVEWLRLACGAGLYFVVRTVLHGRAQVTAIVNLLIVVAILSSLFGLVAYGQPGATSLSSTFGDRQLYTGFLLLLVPLLLALSFGDPDLARRMAAQGAAILSIASLLMALGRSSWLGALVALVALVVMGLLQGRSANRFSHSKHQMVVPLVIVVGAVGLFLVLWRAMPGITARASTLTSAAHDPSFAWRLKMWRGAWQLIRERPLFGWGIGTFPLEQSRTVPGSKPLDLLVHRTGPTLSEEAHNEYLQVAAEMGLVGLGLYLWVLAAFFVAGARALRRPGTREQVTGFRQLVLMGCLAATAGQVVDALANPAWRFAEVSFLFWLMMGLGMAAARVSPPSSETEKERPTVSPTRSRGLWRLGWQVMVLVLTFSAMGRAWAEHYPEDGTAEVNGTGTATSAATAGLGGVIGEVIGLALIASIWHAAYESAHHYNPEPDLFSPVPAYQNGG